jgi:hypothetical protein
MRGMRERKNEICRAVYLRERERRLRVLFLCLLELTLFIFFSSLFMLFPAIL